MSLLDPVPLAAPDGTAIPYLAYVDRVPAATILANSATVSQLLETFQRLAAGLGLPLVAGFEDSAHQRVWVRPPRLYLPTTTDQILCFDWEVWIVSSGYLLELTS